MRGLTLVAIVLVFAIAACSDVAAPVATISDATSVTDAAGAAHFLGGKKFDAHGAQGHHDDQDECSSDDDRDHHDHWGKRGHRWGWRGAHHSSEGKRGHKFLSRGMHGFSAHKLGNRSYDEDDEDCGGSGGDGGGTGTTGTISGTVTNDGLAASGFPVFLLNAAGTAVMASTTTATDGTGSYSFPGVDTGTYLVCEADPFVELYGFLGETRPATGPPCPTGYAPRGFNVNVGGGATAGGNDFSNFGLT